MPLRTEDDRFVSQVVDLLQSGLLEPTGSARGTAMKYPWSVTPREYLDFAREDFGGGGARGLVNALGNAKRALHCQVDSILYALGLYEAAQRQRWDFPARLAVCVEAGAVAPRTLNRLNKLRNEVEHEYTAPDSEQTLEAYMDVVELFIAATQSLTREPYDYIDFDVATRETTLEWVAVQIESESRLLTVRAGPGPYSREGLAIQPEDERYRSLIVAALAAYERNGPG